MDEKTKRALIHDAMNSALEMSIARYRFLISHGLCIGGKKDIAFNNGANTAILICYGLPAPILQYNQHICPCCFIAQYIIVTYSMRCRKA